MEMSLRTAQALFHIIRNILSYDKKLSGGSCRKILFIGKYDNKRKKTHRNRHRKLTLDFLTQK